MKNQIKEISFYLLLILFLSAALTLLVSCKKQKSGEILRLPDGHTLLRQPTADDRFYPAQPDELYQTIEEMMKSSPSKGIRGVRAILVPHAGYVYSGKVAAESFREVNPNFNRVFILASNHRGDIFFNGVSIPEVTHYAIPGAPIPLSDVIEALRKNPLFTSEMKAHAMHMIEVELPFLFHLKRNSKDPSFSIVPMIVGNMTLEQIKQLSLILSQYADDKTLFVFSVDLSHFFNNRKARELDQFTIDSIMSQDPEALAKATTDGNHVLLTLLELATIKGLQPTLLQYANSGQINNDFNRVVGYASIVFHDPLSLSPSEKEDLLLFARQTVEKAVKEEKQTVDPVLLEKHPIYHIPRSVFVTLKKNGLLRGCIGDLKPTFSLIEGVLTHAQNAALRDQRFSPVKEEELADITVSISVLDYPQRIQVANPMDYLKVIKPHGIILIHKGSRSTYLPQVWEDIGQPEVFLASLCQKQGKEASCWMDTDAMLYKYLAFEFGETH